MPPFHFFRIPAAAFGIVAMSVQRSTFCSRYSHFVYSRSDCSRPASIPYWYSIEVNAIEVEFIISRRKKRRHGRAYANACKSTKQDRFFVQTAVSRSLDSLVSFNVNLCAIYRLQGT